MSSAAPSARRPPPGGSQDLWVLAVAAVAATVVGWLWAAGELAAALATGRLPSVGASGALSVAAGVLSRPGHPGAAWPPGSHVPGALGYWATAAAIAALAVTAALVGTAAWHCALRPAQTARRRRPGFATPAQVRAELGAHARRRGAGTVRPSLGPRP